MNAVIYYLSKYADALDQGKTRDTVRHSENLRDVVQLIINLTARAKKAEVEYAQSKGRVYNEMMFSESVQGQNLDLVRKVSELEDELVAARLRLAESEDDAEQMEKDLNFKILELKDLLAEAEERE